MNTNSNSTKQTELSPKQLDQLVVGYYVEHDPADPWIPNGVYAEAISSHKPVVVGLTYSQIVSELRRGNTPVLGNDVLESFKSNFAADPRNAGYTLDLIEFAENSTWLSLEEE